MPITRTVKYNSDALERIFWKGYEFYEGCEIRSLEDMVIDAVPISLTLELSKEFVLRWIDIVQKEMGIKPHL
jgi:hypothetical protein